jgi:methionyl-tRNA formyltransferase
MKNLSKTIVFFGTDDFSLVALQGLIESGYNIAAVVTKPDSKSGRGQTLQPSVVKKLALQHDIPVWQPLKVTEINDKISALGDVAGVLSSYGKIIPESTINLFNPGIINFHPSLLPLYRGPSPIESDIKNGDKQTGVTIMQLTAGMDSGPIYGQIVHELSGHETRIDLYQTLASAGVATLLQILPSVLSDPSIIPSPQDDSKAVYCSLLSKDDAWLKPESTTAVTAERLVRAYLGFPKTKIDILDRTLIITKAHVSSEQKSPLDIKCVNGDYLSIDELIAPSGRTMSARDFLNGYAA